MVSQSMMDIDIHVHAAVACTLVCLLFDYRPSLLTYSFVQRHPSSSAHHNNNTNNRTDFPAYPGAAKDLVNDLDLFLVHISDRTGNVSFYGADPFGVYDDVNNNEQITIPNDSLEAGDIVFAVVSSWQQPEPQVC